MVDYLTELTESILSQSQQILNSTFIKFCSYTIYLTNIYRVPIMCNALL